GRSASVAGLISSADMRARLGASRWVGKSENLSAVIARSGATKQSRPSPRMKSGLLRFARNDDGTDRARHPQNKTPGLSAGALFSSFCLRSVALAEQLQQQREQVDEVQVERQRACD